MADMSKINFNIDGVNNEFDIKDKVARNYIALNKSTLGYSSGKNLFNKDGDINRIYNNTVSNKNTVSENVITFGSSFNKGYLSGQFISNVKYRKLIVSGNVLNVTSSLEGDTGIIMIHDKNTAARRKEHIISPPYTGNFSFEFACGECDEILISAGVVNGASGSIQIENLMVRYADITDSTYEPYKPSVNERLTANENDINTNKSDILKAEKSTIINQSTIGFQSKNILPNVQPSTEYEGITYTVNADKSITCNGTTGSTPSYYSLNSIFTELPDNVDVIFSGCPAGGSYDTYALQLYEEATPNAKIHWNDLGTGVTGKLPKTNNGKYRGMIVIRPNQTVENLTFYPMLRYAGTDDTYEPYVPSVNERLVEVENNKLNLNFGYVYSGYGGNTGWKRLAHCEFTPTSTGIIRDTTLYIEKMPGTERGWSESSECEGILKFRVLGNKNSSGTYSMGSLFINALLNKELPSDEIALIGKVEGSVLIAEIWCKITALYSGYRAAMISNTNRTNGVNPNTQTHWILDSSGSNVSAVDSYPAWTYTTTKIIDYYGDIIKGLSDRITALENK